MADLVFVGLGLGSERNMSLLGLDKAKAADRVFAELYTSLMPELDLKRLEKLIGKRVQVVSRQDLEEDCGKTILDAAEKATAALLVPGDPLIATTHVDLRIRAEKRGIKTVIVQGASILSAAMGLSGLQNYKFGRSVTIPFDNGNAFDPTPYSVIEVNRKAGLHTLCYLDIRTEDKRYMTVKDALKTLLTLEEQKRKRVITSETLAVGIARAGSEDPTVKSDFVKELTRFDFGKPPHSLVFPGRLHFMEAEALVTLAHAPEEVREMAQ